MSRDRPSARSGTKGAPLFDGRLPLRPRDAAGGFENVFQVLQVMPGAAGINDEDGKIAMRGGGPEHNLIVIDGIQIHRPQRLGDFMGSFVNPATIESVSLDASGLEAPPPRCAASRWRGSNSIATRRGSRPGHHLQAIRSCTRFRTIAIPHTS